MEGYSVNHHISPKHLCDNSVVMPPLTKCAARFLTYFAPTDFDASEPRSLRVKCFIVLIEPIDTQEGGSEWLGKRCSPAGGFVRDPFSWSIRLCGLASVGLGAVEPQCESPLGARILAVEHTI